VAPSLPSPTSIARRARAVALLALLGALVVFAGVFGGPSRAASAAVAPPVACQARAGGATLAVVVDFGGGRVRTRCTEPGGSGIDVLRRAGFALVTQSYGTVGGDSAVCAIRDPETETLQGCESGPSCLTCLAPDSWGYFPGYRYSQIGGADTQPGAGTVEAWRWGRSTSWGGSRPSVADVCDEPDPEPPPTTPTTRPPGGGGTTPAPPGGGGTTPAPPGGGGPNGGTTPGGGGTPGASDPSTTPPAGGSSTTAPGASTTTAPGDAGAAPTEADDDDGGSPGRPSADDGGADDERSVGLPTTPAADRDGGGGGGAPVVPLVVTLLVVAAVAALALRARRSRAGSDPTPGAPA
jgi:hypothetical protein